MYDIQDLTDGGSKCRWGFDSFNMSRLRSLSTARPTNRCLRRLDLCATLGKAVKVPRLTAIWRGSPVAEVAVDDAPFVDAEFEEWPDQHFHFLLFSVGGTCWRHPDTASIRY